jgi:ABC-type branched-subunit amino acid transport system substrate-binding protein
MANLSTPHIKAKRYLSALGVGVAGALTVAACGSTSAATSKGPIPLGFVAPLTGIGASAGVGALEGADVAIKAIAAAGGVLGRPLNLVIGNDNTDAVDALPVVQKQLSIDNVVASYGPDSDLTDAVTRYYVGAHVPAIIWGGQDPEPTYISPYIWRITPADSQLGVAMALNAWLKGYRSAAFLFGNDDNGKALGADVAAAWTKLGGTTAVTVQYTPGQTSYRSEVQQVVNAHPQVILFRALATDAGTLFSNLKELEGLSIPMVGDDTSDQTGFTQAIGLATQQKAVTSTDTGTVTGAGYDFFNALYMKTEGHPPLSQANFAYDGITLLALAIDKAGSTDPSAIAAAIPEVENPNNTQVFTYAEGLAALKAGKNIKFVGVSGPLNFDKYHHVYGPFAGYVPKDVSGDLTLVQNITAAQLQAATP